LAKEVGLPIDPPQRNVNSRFALETAELVRAQEGDAPAGVFYHDVSRAFFAERTDISKPDAIIPIAERLGITGSAVEAAWRERRYSVMVDTLIREGLVAGVTGVPALAWPNGRAVVGMRPAADIVNLLRDDDPSS
jgi:predicted DsbA family dithiol-disulfide isomerase